MSIATQILSYSRYFDFYSHFTDQGMQQQYLIF